MSAMVPPLEIDGRPFAPRGVNLGSWLNIEDFMLGTPGTEWQVLREWDRFCGRDEARAWHEAYLDAFLGEDDFRFIASCGFNCVRLPVHWRRLESAERPGEWIVAGFARVRWALDTAWCHGLRVLLDLHVAPGGQNTTPPADNTWGSPMLWTEEVFQRRTVAIWEELAVQFAGHEGLLGFNLLNEPQINQYGPLDPHAQAAEMSSLNRRLVEAVRRQDADVWIVLGAPLPRESITEHFDREILRSRRVAWSFHHYPMANWEGGINTEQIRPDHEGERDLAVFLEARLEAEIAFAAEAGCPVLLGEFGIHRDWGNRALALRVVAAQAELCRRLGFGWMVWSYKDIGAMGLVSPRPDTPWRRWVERPEWRDHVRREMARASELHHGVESWLPHDATSNRVRDFSFGLIRIGLASLLNHRFFSDFAAAFPPAERVAMAESFRFDQCEPRHDHLNALKAGM